MASKPYLSTWSQYSARPLYAVVTSYFFKYLRSTLWSGASTHFEWRTTSGGKLFVVETKKQPSELADVWDPGWWEGESLPIIPVEDLRENSTNLLQLQVGEHRGAYFYFAVNAASPSKMAATDLVDLARRSRQKTPWVPVPIRPRLVSTFMPFREARAAKNFSVRVTFDDAVPEELAQEFITTLHMLAQGASAAIEAVHAGE